MSEQEDLEARLEERYLVIKAAAEKVQDIEPDLDFKENDND